MTAITRQFLKKYQPKLNLMGSDEVFQDIMKQQHKFYLIIGGCGTGKSYLCNSLRKKLFLKNCLTICPTNYLCDMIGRNGKTIYKHCYGRPGDLKPRPFKQKYVFLEETFLFQIHEAQCIMQCLQPNTILIMSGDPFQIPQITDEYFYQAFTQEQLKSIQVYKLTKYYRAEDPKLQNILKTFVVPPYEVDLYDLKIKRARLDKVLYLLTEEDYTLITGTHKRKQAFINTINEYMGDRVFEAADENLYFIGQKVFLSNQYGSIQEIGHIESYMNETFLIKTESGELVERHIENEINKPYWKNGRMVDNYVPIEPPMYFFINGSVCTSHIIQGRTLEGAIIDVDDLFASGSAYSAIGRCKYMSNIYIYGKVEEGQYVFKPDLKNIYAK